MGNKESIFIDCANDFYTDRFNEVCAVLGLGEKVWVCVNCIGHTRNNMVQEAYKRAFAKKYGNRLTVECSWGVCCYSYSYTLKQ